MCNCRSVIIVFILFSAIFQGCFEKEELITPREIEEIRIPWSLYEYQTYFSLSAREITGNHRFDTWDLGFACGEESHSIILNSSRYMTAGNTGITDFDAVTSNVADTMIFDDSSGDPGSAALYGWADYSDPGSPIFPGNVYIIGRGFDEDGVSFGFKKVVFIGLDGGTYLIRHANLDGSDDHTSEVSKLPGVNYVLFSFDNGGVIDVQEPPSTSWDICFTKYSTVIPDDFGVPTPYLVRGVLINYLGGVGAVLDTLNLFYDIDATMLSGYNFSDSQDLIGYRWKEYRDDTYTLLDKMSYVIRDGNGNAYKLRFTDYFNALGEKGYPAFELESVNQ